MSSHSAVIDGQVQYLSVSSLDKAETCLRSWWYRYVAHIVEPVGAAPAAGVALHSELERYLRTGDRNLSALALSGLHLLPERGDHLLIEHPINGEITADGVPIKGRIDLIDTAYEQDVVEVIDWKWKRDGKNAAYMLEPNELLGTLQMSGYGAFVAVTFPRVTHVRLSHGYFPLRGRKPFKSHKLHGVEDVVRAWERATPIARTIKHAATQPTAETVDANTNSCGRYGGCTHREYCTAFGRHSLANVFGETAAKELKMGLMETLGLATPATGPAIDLKAKLLAEEATARASSKPVEAIPGFAAAWTALENCGRGYPALGGAAAIQRTLMLKLPVTNGVGYAGAGDMGVMTMLDPAHVIELGNEMAGVLQSVLPPDAPASKPELAAKPLEPVTQADLAPTSEPAPEPKRGPGRPKKAPQIQLEIPVSPTADVTPIALYTPPTPVVDSPQVEAKSAVGTFSVFVDAIPNRSYESLHPYVDELCSALCRKYNAGGIRDIRCASKDSALGYGGWRGAVAACVREIPPPIGTYYLDTRGNEIAAEVADAMRTVCEAMGGLYVRGIQ